MQHRDNDDYVAALRRVEAEQGGPRLGADDQQHIRRRLSVAEHAAVVDAVRTRLVRHYTRYSALEAEAIAGFARLPGASGEAFRALQVGARVLVRHAGPRGNLQVRYEFAATITELSANKRTATVRWLTAGPLGQAPGSLATHVPTSRFSVLRRTTLTDAQFLELLGRHVHAAPRAAGPRTRRQQPRGNDNDNITDMVNGEEPLDFVTPLDNDDAPLYEVAEVLGRRQRRGQVELLVLWRGYAPSEASWEPLANLNEAARQWFEEHEDDVEELTSTEARLLLRSLTAS